MKTVGYIILLLAIYCFADPVINAIFAQAERERPASNPRQWNVHINDAYYGFTGVQIIDLDGVCLYVRPHGIAAVPKSLLAPGVGCQ